MKKILISWMIILIPSMAFAQLVERIYVSTDRDVYLSGEEIFCSLFDVDASNGFLSAFSAVSYLELISTDGTVAESKVGLMQGRGAGSIRIPASAPTGNYRLVAYTAQNANEEGTGWMAGSRIVSVFNTTASTRVVGGVDIVSEKDYEAIPVPVEKRSGDVLLSLTGTPRKGTPFHVNLSNHGPVSDVSVSVYSDDGILAPENGSLADFLPAVKKAGAVRFTGNRLPEYDGEIIAASVEGLSADYLEETEGQAVAFLSSAGAPANVYVGKVDRDGRILFFTNNIYGSRELVCEVSMNRKVTDGYIGLVDPFVHPSAGTVPSLKLSPGLYGPLVARKAGLRDTFPADTLVEFLPRREDLLLEGLPVVQYHLDDYNRFPSVQEILVEFVSQLRVHKSRGKNTLQMVLPDATRMRSDYVDNILVMIDGVVITDLDMLLGMDAMLLDDIVIYRHPVVIGMLPYNGIVNFITKKNYVTALSFPSNVRVVDFKGVSYPVSYAGEPPSSGLDYRQLLFWHPALKIDAGESIRIPLVAPSYAGRFKVVVEGLTASGDPLRSVYSFEVE